MKKIITSFTLLLSVFLMTSCSKNEPEVSNNSIKETKVVQEKELNYQEIVNQDTKVFRSYFSKKFPNVDVTEFKDGAYAIDAATREQWLEIEDFPPYELSIDEGEEFFVIPFANGKTYASCFKGFEDGVRQNYPYFDTESNQVITLEQAINACRISNGETALDYGQGELATISAYIANLSRDKEFNIKVSNKAAYNAYMEGKKFFYAKRGQLNFSCADCHMKISGSNLRADILSAAIGHPTGMPVYRSNWGELGTIGHRYRECNKNVRAEPLAYQSDAYKNLEYFQTVMSNGFVVNGPSSRK